MATNGGNKLDRLSNLRAQLRDLELEHVQNDDGEAVDARVGVADALEQYHNSRYRFGQALAAYKAFFAEGRVWMQAAKLIGEAIGRDERTIRRIVEDFERVSEVPTEVIQVLEARGIDLAARKNAGIATNLIQMPAGEVTSKPTEAVAQAAKAAKAAKAEKEAKKPGQFATAVAETAGAPLTREEKQRYAIRLKIRSAWAGIHEEKKLEELFEALVEEMHDALGLRNAIDIKLTPRPSALTLDGRRKFEVAA